MDICFLIVPVVMAPIEGGPPLAAVYAPPFSTSLRALTGFLLIEAYC